VDGGNVGADIREIRQEYEDSKTPESHFVHDIDKMEETEEDEDQQ